MADLQSSLTNDQLKEVALAAGENAVSLISDARFLLDADRFPRAYALSVLALEELGKVELCGEMLASELEEKDLRRAWSHHTPKLWRAQFPATLCANTVDRVFANPITDHAARLRGLYVDLPTEPGGAPGKPSDVTRAMTEEIVAHVELVVASYRERGWQAWLWWPIEIRSAQH